MLDLGVPEIIICSIAIVSIVLIWVVFIYYLVIHPRKHKSSISPEMKGKSNNELELGHNTEANDVGPNPNPKTIRVNDEKNPFIVTSDGSTVNVTVSRDVPLKDHTLTCTLLSNGNNGLMIQNPDGRSASYMTLYNNDSYVQVPHPSKHDPHNEINHSNLITETHDQGSRQLNTTRCLTPSKECNPRISIALKDASILSSNRGRWMSRTEGIPIPDKNEEERLRMLEDQALYRLKLSENGNETSVTEYGAMPPESRTAAMPRYSDYPGNTVKDQRVGNNSICCRNTTVMTNPSESHTQYTEGHSHLQADPYASYRGDDHRKQVNNPHTNDAAKNQYGLSQQRREIHHYYNVSPDRLRSEESLYIANKNGYPYRGSPSSSMDSYGRGGTPMINPCIPITNAGMMVPVYMPPAEQRQQMIHDTPRVTNGWSCYDKHSKSPISISSDHQSPHLNNHNNNTHHGMYIGNGDDRSMIYAQPECNLNNGISYSVDNGHIYSTSLVKWRTSPTGHPTINLNNSRTYSVDNGNVYSTPKSEWHRSPNSQPRRISKFRAGDIIRRSDLYPHIMCDFGGSIGLAKAGDTMCVDYATDDLVYYIVGGEGPVPDHIETDGLFFKVGERQR